MATRRAFVRGAALTTGAGLLGLRPHIAAAESPPETTTIRLGLVPSVCLAPQYVAEDLLRSEGFTDIRYTGAGPIGTGGGGVPGAKQMGAGEVDVSMNFAAPLVVALDAGTPIVVLAGVHVGCFELIATERVHTIRRWQTINARISESRRYAE